jgi:hypothetical protein
MVRNSRMLTRIFFALVLVAGLLGAWYVGTAWEANVAAWEMPVLDENSDWIDTVSVIGEEVIQFFLGWTSS